MLFCASLHSHHLRFSRCIGSRAASTGSCPLGWNDNYYNNVLLTHSLARGMLWGMHTCMYACGTRYVCCTHLVINCNCCCCYYCLYQLWHFLFRHRCFKVTGPPNFGLSMQTLHVYIYHSQWSENNLCSYCHDFLLSGKIGSLSLGLLWECKCIPRTVPCPNCVCCFAGPFAVMVFIAMWNNQDDTSPIAPMLLVHNKLCTWLGCSLWCSRLTTSGVCDRT